MTRRKEGSEPCICYNALVQTGATVMPLSAEETNLFSRRWQKTFGAHLAKAANVSLSDRGGYDWHLFSYGLVRALEGAEALAEYLAQNHGAQNYSELLVLPNDGNSSLRGARCRCETFPTLDEEGDVYICPANFAWTMIFTHEVGWYGPYFSRACWVR